MSYNVRDYLHKDEPMPDEIRQKLIGDIQRRTEVYSRNHTPEEVKAYQDYYDNLLADFSSKSNSDLSNIARSALALPLGLFNRTREIRENIPSSVMDIAQAHMDKADPDANYFGD